MSKMSELYPQYFKDVSDLTEADVYRICDLFEVGKRDPSGATHHAIKKLLLPGVRTGGKSVEDDVKEARNTLTRRLDMWAEDRANADKRRKDINDSFCRMGDAVHAIDYKLHLEKFGPTNELADQGVHERALPPDVIPAYAPIIGRTADDTAYLAGIGITVRDFDTDVPVQGQLMDGWVHTQPGDTLLSFSQRNNVRPYEVRALNPGMERTGLYDSVVAAVCLRIK